MTHRLVIDKGNAIRCQNGVRSTIPESSTAALSFISSTRRVSGNGRIRNRKETAIVVNPATVPERGIVFDHALGNGQDGVAGLANSPTRTVGIPSDRIGGNVVRDHDTLKIPNRASAVINSPSLTGRGIAIDDDIREIGLSSSI